MSINILLCINKVIFKILDSNDKNTCKRTVAANISKNKKTQIIYKTTIFSADGAEQ